MAKREEQRNLTVPYSAPDDVHAISQFGFIGNTSFFKVHDGSVLDLKTHKIVLDPNAKFKASGYWSNPNETMEQKRLGDWGKTEPEAGA